MPERFLVYRPQPTPSNPSSPRSTAASKAVVTLPPHPHPYPRIPPTLPLANKDLLRNHTGRGIIPSDKKVLLKILHKIYWFFVCECDGKVAGIESSHLFISRCIDTGPTSNKQFGSADYLTIIRKYCWNIQLSVSWSSYWR